MIRRSVLDVYYEQRNTTNHYDFLYGMDDEYLSGGDDDQDPYIKDEDDGDIPPVPALSIDPDATVKICSDYVFLKLTFICENI